jgi:predicted kinase
METTAIVVVFSGLPGSGKSTLARPVAERLEGVWLRVDTIEASLVEAGLPRSFETGLAAYVVVRDVARDNLRGGRSVIIDAVNGVEPARQMWQELSAQFEVPRFSVLVECSDRVEHRRRVESRDALSPYLPRPTWDEVLDREFVRWNEPVLSVDSMQPESQNVQRILEYCSPVQPRRSVTP